MEKTGKLDAGYVDYIKSAPKFGLKDKIGYLCGDWGFNSLQVIINAYFMLFCVNVMGLDAVHFAAIIFICKALDALNDTFIGRAVDTRVPGKGGKMRPWIKWFAVPYAVMTVIMFINLEAAPYAVKIAWVLVAYFIWGIVGTFINVPYGAMSNIITTNQVERTELSNFRSIGSLLGNVGTTTLVPLFLFDANNDPIASRFIILSVGLGIFCLVCLWVTHHFVHERVLVTDNTSSGPKKVNYLQVVKTFAKNRVMIAVVLSYIIYKLFNQTLSQLNQYVFMTYFQDTTLLSFSSLFTIVPMVIGMIVLKPMVKRFGKKALCTWPQLGSMAFYLVTMLLPVNPFTWIACQVLAALCTSLYGLLLWSLIADAVDYQAWLSGSRNDGTVYATITFIVFFAGSLSTSIIALLLEAVGYDAALGSMNQLAGVPGRIKMLAGFWPALGSLLTFICFKFIYNVSDAEMTKVSDELRIRSAKAESEALGEEG